MRQIPTRFLKDRSGATAIEYGLIAAVLSLAIIGGVGTAANSLGHMFGDQSRELQQAFSRSD